MAQQNLNICLVQTTLTWENKIKNTSHFSQLLIDNHRVATDIYVLPEMFNTGFSMQPTLLAEPMNGPTHQWMQKLSTQLNAVICGSLMIEEEGKYYNRFLWVAPDGKSQYYDKKHLFAYADEDKHFTPGHQKTTIKYKGWHIALFVCYDLRFPVWCRSTEEIDLMLFVANWPKVRSYAFKNLLCARAIENQCYTAGCNIVGMDGNGLAYSGDSSVFDYKGGLVSQSTKEELLFITLEKKSLTNFRANKPFWQDKDTFQVSGKDQTTI